MMTEPTAAAVAIDVADLAQLLVCEAVEARPDEPPRLLFCDVTLVVLRVAERLPAHWRMHERTAILQRAVDLAVRCLA
jgi:hypothetical protein